MKPEQKAFLLIIFAVILVVVVSLFQAPVHAQGAVPGVHTVQVTIGASCTQVSSTDIQVKQVFFQNNAAHTMRVGDSNASTTRGALLASGSPGGSMTAGVGFTSASNLNQWYVCGTQNDVLDVIYLQ